MREAIISNIDIPQKYYFYIAASVNNKIVNSNSVLIQTWECDPPPGFNFKSLAYPILYPLNKQEKTKSDKIAQWTYSAYLVTIIALPIIYTENTISKRNDFNDNPSDYALFNKWQNAYEAEKNYKENYMKATFIVAGAIYVGNIIQYGIRNKPLQFKVGDKQMGVSFYPDVNYYENNRLGCNFKLALTY
jgi:hypothetical protein